MDKQPRLHRKLNNLSVGALVRVASFVDICDNQPIYAFGIVLEIENPNQTSLFPSAVIYNLKSNQRNREFISSFEVISSLNGTI